VDLTAFRPGNRDAARQQLGLSKDHRILLFAASDIRRNPWKDYQTLRTAVGRTAEHLPDQNILFLALGEDAPAEQLGKAKVVFAPYQSRLGAVARYYQAADVYVHAARVDTFPNSVIEALACAAPVVATAVGGIPEQVRGLRIAATEIPNPKSEIRNGDATGVLTPAGDAEAMGEAVVALLSNESLRLRLSDNAARDAVERFDLNGQAETYLEWYQEVLSRSRANDKTDR
jgi:glycosyltransferase involved in cell wall biosynthesis